MAAPKEVPRKQLERLLTLNSPLCDGKRKKEKGEIENEVNFDFNFEF